MSVYLFWAKSLDEHFALLYTCRKIQVHLNVTLNHARISSIAVVSAAETKLIQEEAVCGAKLLPFSW